MKDLEELRDQIWTFLLEIFIMLAGVKLVGNLGWIWRRR